MSSIHAPVPATIPYWDHPNHDGMSMVSDSSSSTPVSFTGPSSAASISSRSSTPSRLPLDERIRMQLIKQRHRITTSERGLNQLEEHKPNIPPWAYNQQRQEFQEQLDDATNKLSKLLKIDSARGSATPEHTPQMSSSADSIMPATQSMTSFLQIPSGLPSQDATNDLFRVSSHLSDMKRDFAQNCTTSLTPVSLPEHDRQQYWATLSQLKRQIPELEGILPMLYLLFNDDGLVYNMTLAVILVQYQVYLVNSPNQQGPNIVIPLEWLNTMNEKVQDTLQRFKQTVQGLKAGMGASAS